MKINSISIDGNQTLASIENVIKKVWPCAECTIHHHGSMSMKASLAHSTDEGPASSIFVYKSAFQNWQVGFENVETASVFALLMILEVA